MLAFSVLLLAACGGARAPHAISPEASAAWAVTQELERPEAVALLANGDRPLRPWRKLEESDQAMAMVADCVQGGMLLVLVPRGQQAAPDPGAHAAYNAMLVVCPHHGGPLTKVADALVDVLCTGPAAYRARLVALQSSLAAGDPG